MTTYFFQIQDQDKNKAWEQIKQRQVSFEKWKQAVEFAYNLSEMFDAEIRMTEENPKGNGKYFSYKQRPNYV